MKTMVMVMALAVGVSVHAEWYKVTSVLGYNQIEAELSEGSESKSRIAIRIKNLEKIEYIENDRAKVLLSGSEPRELMAEIMLDQVVWVEGLENVGGEYAAHVYPSYEQVLNVYMQKRMTGAYAFSPAVKAKLNSVGQKMISALKSSTPPRMNENNKGSKSSSKAYDNEYMKVLFVYDALDWFKNNGQYLPIKIQEMYVDWLSDYMSTSGADARDYEVKIRDFQKRSDLYRDFIFE